MLVRFTVSATSRKVPLAELLVRLIVRLVGEVAGLPTESCICTVIGLETTPAIFVLGAVVMTSLVGVPAKMSKGLDVAGVRPEALGALVATRVYPVPTLSIERLLKVAVPLTAAFVRVPPNVPPLGLLPIVKITLVVLVVTLPN